jgi:hypothetical protein
MMLEMLLARSVCKAFFVLLIVFNGTLLAGESGAIPDVLPPVSEIVERMMAHNERQNQALIEFRAQRKFFASNIRFKMDSTMVVQTVFRQPDSMESSIVSQNGSELIKARVFDEILKSEGETSKKEDKQQVDITPRNYNFSLVAQETCDGRSCYRLRIFPKHKDKYSLQGDAWIDAEDYAIVRLHGAPAKKPSFWTLKTEIDKHYRKIDGMWLADQLKSTSDIFIAGHSTLSIEYVYQEVLTFP